jgi:hypothetical protein
MFFSMPSLHFYLPANFFIEKVSLKENQYLLYLPCHVVKQCFLMSSMKNR